MLIRAVFIALILVYSLTAVFAQEEVILKVDSTVTDTLSDVYVNVDYQPEFPGGKKGLLKFYEETSVLSICSKANCRTVYYQIVVDTTGRAEFSSILRGDEEKYNIETKRLVNQMPLWEPGKINGIPVNVRVTLDIKYKFE